MLEQDDEKTRVITLFLLASAILVTVAIVVLVVIVVAGRFGTPTQVTSVAPYNLKSRPYPTATDLAQIFPPQLGQLKRSQFSGSFSDFSVTYTDSANNITVIGSQTVSLTLAQFSVQQDAKSAPGDAQKDLGDDPSYFLVAPTTGPARFAWSHDRWYFDAQASSKAALDEFMKVFKY